MLKCRLHESMDSCCPIPLPDEDPRIAPPILTHIRAIRNQIHPTQIMQDLITLEQYRHQIIDRRLVYQHSFMCTCEHDESE